MKAREMLEFLLEADEIYVRYGSESNTITATIYRKGVTLKIWKDGKRIRHKLTYISAKAPD